MNEEILTVPQAAKYCAISRWTLRKFVRSGELKAARTPGGNFRILKSDLESFIYEKEMYPLVHNRSSNKKILIVDDDLLIRDLLTKMLSKNGYKTEIGETEPLPVKTLFVRPEKKDLLRSFFFHNCL